MNGAGSVAQGAAAVALALGLTLLATRRMSGSVAICAGQMVAAAVAALAQGRPPVAVAELAGAAALAWWAIVTQPELLPRAGRRRFVRADNWNRSTTLQPAGRLPLVAGTALAALALTIPSTGIAFAVVQLGSLAAATDRRPARQVLGLAAMQSGLVLSALAVGLAGWDLALTVLPVLPILGAVGLWLGADRRRAAALLAPRSAVWIDAAACCAALLCTVTLPWQLGLPGGTWRLDARAVHMILLICALAVAGSWGQRDARPVWGSRVAILAGTALAVLFVPPLLAWLGMALATAGAIGAALPARAEAWRRLNLGCTGLGLALFGAIALHASRPPLAAVAAAILGYGSLAVLAPELTIAAAALIVRSPAPPFLLMALGLGALAIGAVGLAGLGSRSALSWPGRLSGLDPGITRPSSHDRPGLDATDAPDEQGKMAGRSPGPARGHGPAVTMDQVSLVILAQGGIAVFAFGLGTSSGDFAGLLQLTLLALTQCALLLARRDGLDRLAAFAGLGGVPPFGLFASLALVLAATAATAPLFLLPLGVGLAVVARAVLRQLPAERRLCASPAWLPLALLLLCGFAMPVSWLAWFRLAAQ